MHSTDPLRLFAGKRILVVEDEYFLADDTRRTLVNLQALVVGPVATVADALALIGGQEIDAAMLDIHLGDELVFPVADKLEERNIPFVFATGFDPSIVPQRFAGFVLCQKPTELQKIARALFDPPGNEAMN